MQKRILLVEDEKELAEIYYFLLTQNDWKVELASDGMKALQCIQEKTYDLVLLDVMLPKLDGLDVLRRLAKIARVISPGKIVMLTNFGEDTVINDALKLGANGYLIKSELNPKQFISQVKKFLLSPSSYPTKAHTSHTLR
jgi:DNA-binding response OmpR family regulator